MHPCIRGKQYNTVSRRGIMHVAAPTVAGKNRERRESQQPRATGEPGRKNIATTAAQPHGADRGKMGKL